MIRDYITIDAAAKYLHCHPVWLRSQASQGRIPAYKIGRRWLFCQNELSAWVEEQANGSREHSKKTIKLQID